MCPLLPRPPLLAGPLACRIGLVAVGIWAAVTLGLAATALLQGTAFPVALLPDFEAFSGGTAQVGGACVCMRLHGWAVVLA